MGYQLNFDTPTNLFYWNFIKGEIERLYVFYKAKFPLMKSVKISQIDLLKYLPGGKYETHTDHSSNTLRHLSIIINLNNEYEGGDLNLVKDLLYFFQVILCTHIKLNLLQKERGIV